MKRPQDMTNEELQEYATLMVAASQVTSVIRYGRPDVIAPVPIRDFITQTMSFAYGDTPEAMLN